MLKAKYKYRLRLDECFDMAKKFLILPDDPPDLFEDDCPSIRFPAVENSAESNFRDYHIIINRVWAEGCYNANRPEFDYIILHELRHMHQQAVINQYLNDGKSGNEKPEDIEQWMQDYNDYQRNDGSDEAREKNATQSIERDACAYGVILTNFLYIDSPMEINLKLPEVTSSDIQRYLEEKPEIINAINKLNSGYRL